jgi:hypothetical protein
MKIQYNKQSKKWEVIDCSSAFRADEVMGEFDTKEQAQRYLNMLISA